MVASVMLLCAFVASLAFCVLVAQAVCVCLFTLFRVHATQVAARKAAPVQAQLRVIGG